MAALSSFLEKYFFAHIGHDGKDTIIVLPLQ